jgi:hypothetical protein
MVYTGMDNTVILSPLPNKNTQTKVRINRTWLDSIFFGGTDILLLFGWFKGRKGAWNYYMVDVMVILLVEDD